MSEDELKAIEQRVQYRGEDATCCGFADEQALVTEVRRLRELVLSVERGTCPPTGEAPCWACPWCNASPARVDGRPSSTPSGHRADCPAFSGAGAIR